MWRQGPIHPAAQLCAAPIGGCYLALSFPAVASARTAGTAPLHAAKSVPPPHHPTTHTHTHTLPHPLLQDPAWWELLEVQRRQLYDVCRELVELYRLPRPTYVCLHQDVTTRAPPGQVSPTTAATTPLRSPALGAAAGVGAAGGAPASAAVSLAGPAASQQTAVAPRGGSDGEETTAPRANGTAEAAPVRLHALACTTTPAMPSRDEGLCVGWGRWRGKGLQAG